jgi:hypothetical protein
MILAAASVARDCTSYGVLDLDPRRFGVVNADSGAGIRLEPPIFRRDSISKSGDAIHPIMQRFAKKGSRHLLER